jgi:hypothetical protein
MIHGVVESGASPPGHNLEGQFFLPTQGLDRQPGRIGFLVCGRGHRGWRPGQHADDAGRDWNRSGRAGTHEPVTDDDARSRQALDSRLRLTLKWRRAA